MTLESGWVTPPLTQHLDVERYIRLCPATASTQGVFFQQLIEAVKKHTGTVPSELFSELEVRRWTTFASYPLRDFMRLAANAAVVLHPEQSLAEGMRRVGSLAYSGFASTMAGRVVLFALGDTLDALIAAVPKAYSVTIPDSKVTIVRHSPRHVVFEMRNVYCFVDTYHRGVIEGAMVARGVEPRIVTRRRERACDVDFDTRY